MFSGSREGFCVVGESCATAGATCKVTDSEGNVKTNKCVLGDWKPVLSS